MGAKKATDLMFGRGSAMDLQAKGDALRAAFPTKDISITDVLQAQAQTIERIDEPEAPHVIISLAPSGSLQMELRGAPQVGRRRIVELRDGDEAEIIRRVLMAQVQNQTAAGTDGAPTKAQVRHWRLHQMFADDRCTFCRAEGRGSGNGKAKGSPRGDGSVTVRTIPAKGKANLRGLVLKGSPGDLDL